MKHIKPFKVETIFMFDIPIKYVSYVLETRKTTLFDDIKIVHSNKDIATIHYTICTTIQKKQLSVVNISIYEKRFRSDFFNRLALLKPHILEIKEKSSIVYVSDKYKPSF